MPSGFLNEVGGKMADGSGIDENGLWGAGWVWLEDGISGSKDATAEV